MAATTNNVVIPAAALPEWASELIGLYESGAANQFILYGNVSDEMLLPLGSKAQIGSLTDFLLRVLMPRFDVILSYDVGNGIRLEQGGSVFSQWPRLKENPELSRVPRSAVETLTHYFRYCANLAQLGQDRHQIGCYIKSADLVAPSGFGGLSYDLNALSMLIRDWSSDSQLAHHSLATFLIAENLNDLHPLIANNPRAARIKIPLPSVCDLQRAFELFSPKYPTALSEYRNDLDALAHCLAGATLNSVEGVLRVKEHAKRPLTAADLVRLKKELVEKDCNNLIEFIESERTLDDFHGQEAIKSWLRQDIALWKANDLAAMPMGYLLCGPVGTGKTYLVECLAGEAGVPVVKFKNFRDKWVGSTEGNLERIFRVIHALGRCYVFIDEADQTLGRRQAESGDSGVSNRVYSMMAEEMSSPANRGRIVWILASSRPDLIEVDLKRPGRIDVKIPIFPTSTPEEGFNLIRALCRKRGVEIRSSILKSAADSVPIHLTPGAAEVLAVKVYRLMRTSGITPAQALRQCLKDYRNPVPRETMEFQIGLAVAEASDIDFVPNAFRPETTGGTF